MTTLWRALLCLCCVASHLAHRHSVLCSAGQQSQPLLINTPSSALTEGSVLHTFTPPSSSYQLISSQDQDCPSDTFSIMSGSNNLVLVRNITIDEAMLSPSCKQGMADGPGFPSIRTYRCLVVRDRTVGIPFTVNVEPAFQVAELVFPQAFYTSTVVEGRSNASLSIITPHFKPRTLPMEGLLVPRYRVTGPLSHMFDVVHEQAGCTSVPVIVTTQPLNRETMQTFELTLEAYAPYNDTIMASTVLRVTVLDINDNTPQFTNSTPNGFQVSVNSSILPGTELAQYFTTDMDLGTNSETRFLVPTAGSEFSIHPLNGALFPFKPLNGSGSYSSEVNVQAEDLGNPTLSTPSRSLTIFVARVSSSSLEISIHDEGESFTVEQQAAIVMSVSEHAAVGEQVTTIDVTSQGSTDLNLALTNAGPCECFSLSSPASITTGRRYFLEVANVLDFELNADGQYRVILTALDRSSTSTLTTTAELLIQVTDENDPPSFPRTYSIEVSEGVPVGTIIGQVMAEDPDSGTNGTLSYSFTATSNMFLIDSNFGLISTSSEIDFEAISSPQLIFEVVATDGSGETATTSLSISITDRNDNPPIFLPTSVDQSVTIREGQNRDHPVFQFVAEDADSGCNGAVQYSIIHADPDVFSLGASSGLLYPKSDSSLDFEKFQSALVVVRVQDLGLEVRFSAQTTLRVNLTDLDDEAPIIDPIGCPCFIRENLHPSALEARCPPLSASDRDAGSTNLIFTISSGDTTLFQIDSNTGVVSTRSPLDREITDSYTLEISVSDGTNVSLPMPLTVIVVDENDEEPTYSQTSVTFTVPADAESGFLVGDLSATDDDAGYNSLVNYVMEQPSAQTDTLFLLDPLSGFLHTRAPLPASPTTYTFTSSARSLVSSQDSSASKMVTIRISGLKNNPPRFLLPVDRHTISETLPIGSTVARIEVQDTDTGVNGQLTYTIAETNTNHSGLFSVHSDGTLRLAREASGQEGRVFAVNVSVTDGGSPALEAHQLLLVSVYSSMYQSGDVELVYNPGVGVCHFNTSVTELQDTSEIILTLPPTEDSTPIAYSIRNQGETPASAFQVSGGSTLRVQSGFRLVLTETIFITLVAAYSPNFHFCSVTIAIDDINNHAPVFEVTSTSFDLYSNTPTGAAVFRVTASDADAGSNARTTYSITTQVPFSVDAESGIIRVSGTLSQQKYRFSVSAVDPMFSSPPSTITVTAEVLGTTNQRPVFTSPSSPLTIPEGSGTQTPSAISDGDGDTNLQAINTFCIASGNLHRAFRIARMGGELMTTDAFDFETLPPEFNVTLMAYDMSLNPAFGLSTVRVVVQDENESPVFTVSEYQANVMEGVNISFPVLDVTAVDEDMGSNGVVTYSLSPEAPFSIDSQTGAISTSSNLNRNFNEEIVFNVTATDGGNPRLSTMAEVRVSLTDINNNCPIPIIPGPIMASEALEVGDEVTQIRASDMDDGANAVISFAIVSGNGGRYFALDPWSGSLRLARTLDFEQGPREFTLTLRVRNLDDSLLCSDHTLVIRVTDSNDHFPVFSAAVYDCNVTESFSADRQPPCQVSATDSDGTGNTVSYSLHGTPPFSINANTGVITQTAGTISSLDRLERPAYVLQVRAIDSHRSAPKTSTAIVRVSVVDVNNPPSTGSQGNSFVFFEGAPQNTLLSFAHMHDIDSTPSFSTITYQILDQSSLFRLDETTGAVFLNGELDYETMASPLTFFVIGTNSDHEPETSSTLRYQVSIGDVNENFLPPVFSPQTNPAVISLSRSASIGSSVISLNATDPEGQPIQYDITGGSGVGYFQINPSSGEITTIFPLTSVSLSQLSLLVRALDDNTFPLPAWHQITIVLTPELSMLPQFIRSVFRASPLEGSAGAVAFVRAEQDELNDMPICYTLLDSTNTFSIDQQTGAIILNSNSMLDRERTPLYNVTVGAGTAQFPDASRALLIIEPTDNNDNRPSFTLGSFTVRVPANLPLNEGLVRIFAVDDDAESVLRYNMTTIPVDSPFILSETGVLSLTRALNRTEATTHILTVAVTDGVFTAQDSTITVTVDPPPVNSDLTLNSISVVRRPENTPLGTLLATVSRRTFTQGAVVYRIRDLPSTVSIHPSTGEMYLTAPLDYETRQSLSFIVEALDGHHSPPVATVLQIMVEDVNDNRPVFLQPAYTFTISEADFRPGMMAGRVNAYASDRDIDDVLTYSLVDSTHPSSAAIFNVTSGGAIIGSSQVDREALPFHTLTLGVSDNRDPPLRDFVTVTINVEDADDNVPQFIPSELSVYLPEDTTQGEVVYTVRAFDPDGGPNSDINYRLVTGSTHFSISGTTGDVTLTMPLDAEQRLQHSLEISAFNPTNPQSVSTRNLNLSIHVIDILDSHPELVVENMVTIRENYPPYSYVTRVQPTSTSSSTPRQVYFSIVGGNALGHFIMEPLTGVVRTTVSLDREAVPTYRLVIEGAYGNGFESRVNLTISVRDANDKSPRFSSPFIRIEVPEDAVFRTPLPTLNITDPDEGDNGRIDSVIIADSYAAEIFSIDSSGHILINQDQQLDREGRFSEIRFTVYAIDSGTTQKFSAADIQIEITDANDPPRFEQSEYTFILGTPAVVGDPQFRVQAEDEDIGSRGDITYSISSGDLSIFSITAETGVVSVLDVFMLQERYSLEVTATDGGGLRATVDLTVITEPCNFMNLTFSPSTAQVSVQVFENASVGDIIVRGSDLTVVDLKNVGSNFTFSLPVENPSFSINPLSGDISITNLDRETQQLHMLVIQAADSAEPTRVAQAMLLVTILDINDNAPVFNQSKYSVPITTDTEAGSSFLRVQATDADGMGPNSEIIYSITPESSSFFSIEESTGILSLSSRVPRESVNQVIVVATDRGDPPMSSMVMVTVNVVDPRAPRFLQNIYTVSISENTNISTNVLTVMLAANSSQARISFRFINTESPFPFSISASAPGAITADISLVDPGLNYEVRTNYTLNLRARDSAANLNGFATVTVYVQDFNDNSPIFESFGLYSENVLENVTIGTTIAQVRATDADSNMNAEITYQLGTDNSGGIFSVDSLSGEIVLSDGTLDFEREDSHTIEVLAVDGGSPSLTGTATVVITVGNINDNPPIFREKVYNTSVRDDDSPRSTNLFVFATDLDQLGSLVYDIVEGGDAFTVSSNGLISLNISNPSEESYRLNVSAFDGLFYGFTTVLVSVEGVNSAPPAFTESVYSGMVVESSPAGVFVAQVFATDMDRGSNGQVTYSLQFPPVDFFSINETSGIVTTTTTAARIDREDTTNYILQVTATDGGSFSSHALVCILVGDVNDNDPMFEIFNYTGTVINRSPGQTYVLQVSAFDRDAGDNGRITYMIVGPPGIFAVDPETGVIFTVAPADIELSSRNITVTAQDNGMPPRTASVAARVSITVTADNLRVPVFDQNPYIALLLENATIGTLVTQVSFNSSSADFCRDMQLQGDTSRFQLQERGLVLINNANLEVRNYTLRIEVMCVYNGENLRQGITTVIVVVEDVNERPFFSSFFPRGTVPENMRGSVVRFSESTRAQDDGGMVTYSLTGEGSHLFDIGRLQGDLIATGPLDFESTRSYSLRIIATDMGSPPLSAALPVLVVVTDVNDNPPMFDQEMYFVNVSENAGVGMAVHTASATDLDADSVITYNISGSTFTIDSTSGEVTVATTLDRERVANYSEEISAFDGATKTVADLVITLTDVNDRAPMFNENTLYETAIPENYATGVPFFQVSATDADEGINAIVSYEQVLTSNSVNGNITVNRTTGEISFQESPDREAGGEFTLSIRAFDSGTPSLSDTVSVIVRLLDENDNPPRFTRSSYTAGIRENLPPRSLVDIDLGERVEAVDPDYRENGTVSYSIHGEGASYFSINDSDIISLVQFDREANSSIEIVVTATDGGTPPMSSNVTVLINILDQNDNSPMFPQSMFMINVSESVTPGTLIFNVSATDLDSGDNGVVSTYGISGDNSNDFFLNTTTGRLFVQRALDHEDELRRRYELTLIAIDSGPDLRRGRTTLIINIVNENDNSPDFDEDTYFAAIQENATIGTMVVTVRATDSDNLGQAQLLYSIQNAANHPEFHIDAFTGEISVATTLDYETNTSYELTVIASDMENKEDNTSVTVTVIDVNDNPPYFLRHEQALTIQENNEEGYLLVTLETNDSDSVSDPATRTYSITAGNIGNAFRISRLGNLTVQTSLDREDISQYNLTISATDNTPPSLTASTFIVVNVEDVNDNSPTGGHQEIFINLFNGIPPNIPLGSVFVNDSDVANNHRYRLIPTLGGSNIRIDANAGTIHVNRDSLQVGTFNFTVAITDAPNMPADTTILVTITDVAEQTLPNSFRIQFDEVTPNEFVDDYFNTFLEEFKRVVERELSSTVIIQAISIQPSTSPFPPENTDMMLAVSFQNDTYIDPLYAQHILHSNREQLGRIVGVAITAVSVDACSLEPCAVDQACTDAYSEGVSDLALGTQSIVYVGITSTLTHRCLPISSSPCSPGACPGASSCQLEVNRTGQLLSRCVQDCSSLPCRNNGECFDQNPGYYCSCPEGFNGRNCELTLASFSQDSFAVFPSLPTRSFGSVSLEFNTNNGGDALLMHGGRFDSIATDFFSLYFESTQICLNISRGGNATKECVSSWGRTTLGQGDSIWHSISIQYNSTGLILSSVTYDPYTLDIIENSISMDIQFHSLDLDAPLIVGRLPEEFGYHRSNGFPSSFNGFRGCLRNLLINGEPLDFSAPLIASGLSEGCGCEADMCKNGGVCYGTGLCDCRPENTGDDCSEESTTVSFLGDNYFSYTVGTAVQPLKRRRRQGTGGDLYITAQTRISLSFMTDEAEGTLLQLGDPHTSSEYILLQIIAGRVHLRCNLGNGEHTLVLQSQKVNDVAFHTVLVTRTEGALEMRLDETFFNQTTLPGSGENILLEISPQDIFFGAEVEVESGEIVQGFKGCVAGVRLNRKELPFDSNGNNDFAVDQQVGSTVVGFCFLGALSEASHPDEYVFGALGGVLLILFLISLVFVASCSTHNHRKRNRQGHHSIQRANSSPAHGGFTWQSAYSPSDDRKSPSTNDAFSMDVFLAGDSRDNGVAETGLADLANSRQGRPQSPVALSRPESARSMGSGRMSVPPPDEGFTAVSQSNPGFLQESPESSSHDILQQEGKSRFVRHMQSLVRQQSDGTSKSANTAAYIPTELLAMDDVEVKKFIRKKVEAADEDNEDYDVDKMEPFGEEGEFEPLGSIGSLYDFVKDLDIAPPAQRPPKVTASNKPTGTVTNQSRLPQEAAAYSQPTTSSSIRPSSPTRRSGRGKRPKPVVVLSPPSTAPPPPPQNMANGITTAATIPIRSASGPAPLLSQTPPSPPPPGYETKSREHSTEPLLSSPEFSPEHKSAQNGHWVLLGKQSASQPETFDLNGSVGGGNAQKGSAKLRRSGRRSQRVNGPGSQSKDAKNILEKFHHVTTSPNPFGATEESNIL